MHRLTLVFSLLVTAPGLALAQVGDPTPVEPNPMEPRPGPDVQTPLPAAAQPVTEPAVVRARPDSGYDGGFFIQSTDNMFKLKIQGRVQGRFELDNEKVADAMGGDSRETGTAFSIPRARLSLSGHAFSKNVKYKF